MTETTKNTLVYFLGKTMYINVTNLCTCKCVFCIRSLNDEVEGANLWLDEDNIKASDIIEEIKKNNPQAQKEIVFCGYGEPLIKIEIVKEVAKFIKDNYPNVIVRVNSNGHANLIHKRNVVPELVGLVDKMSISLNAHTPELYAELNRCSFDAEVAFKNVKEFIGICQKSGISVIATVVSGFKEYKVDVPKCKEIAESLGAEFKVREWLEDGYS